MKPQRMAAAALSFAHLIGLKRAEEDEDKKARRAEEGDEDPDKKDAARADEEDGDGDENMQSNRAENGDEEEGGDDGDEEGKKGRKAKAEDDKEDDDEEDGDKKSKASAVRIAVRRERARCAQIIAHGIATGRVRQAGVLAFDSELSVKAAKTMLDAGGADQPASKRESLTDRMAAANVPSVGADSDTPAPAGMTKVAVAIIAAGEKARGETTKK